MQKSFGLLLLLASCGQSTTENSIASRPAVAKPTAAQVMNSAKPSVQHLSGDRIVNGPNDTLHVGNLVLRLVPGSKSDFANVPPRQLSFSEASALKQEGNGRVRRIGHTLVVRPFNGSVLRFLDDTYQMRKDEDEEIDTHCRFTGSVPDRPYWIVDSLQWERYHPFLIHKYSGRVTPLTWDPEVSPNRQFFIVATPGLDIESTFNGLQLWKISDQLVSPLWTRVLQNWQPQQVRWLDNRTLAIKQIRFGPTEKTSYVRLLLP